jgi:ribonuclease E
VVVEKGFFGWLKNLFAPAAPAAAPAPVEQATAPATTQEPRNSRDGRSARDSSRRSEPRNDRPEGSRNSRGGERTPRPEGRSDGRPDGRSGRNSERGNRPERAERPERSERPAAPRERQEMQANAVATESANANLNAEAGAVVGMPDAARSETRPERNGRSRGERRPRGSKPGEENRLDDAGNALQGASDVANTPSDEATGEVDSTNRAEPAPREKRSRDRYGRDRKPRGERAERTGTEAGQTSLALETTAAPQEEEDAAPRKSYFTAPVVSAQTQVAVTNSATEHDAGLPATAVVIATEPAATAVTADAVTATAADASVPPTAELAAPVKVRPSAAPEAATASTAAKPGMPAIQTYNLPVDTLKQIAEQSGLAWVNSDNAKIAAVQAAIAAEPQPVHVPRERPAPVIMDDKPLVLVETKRDLRSLTLPFEEADAVGQSL